MKELTIVDDLPLSVILHIQDESVILEPNGHHRVIAPYALFHTVELLGKGLGLRPLPHGSNAPEVQERTTVRYWGITEVNSRHDPNPVFVVHGWCLNQAYQEAVEEAIQKATGGTWLQKRVPKYRIHVLEPD